ncbi:methylenetetrahydrofolate reductase [Serpentinicella alkaliphila]|uniref:Methylenetetrahydrofolate reductase n=1 Tax=Serpentinicella alkaliphila TaxID=1734049 RepID=A0A4V2T3T1_9FIRM|nr:methylenetetrahydrofolate reductase [Serpentinicella alkaliphila]QUH24623.1 methylenetetrahydrofolate reductase [Serpentinicella alkaliphila]TCQ02624.1 5,10-methylenetetrahydrofolate reductase [Serpentinicella alkaliphila]
MNRFKEKLLSKQFLVTVELEPPKGINTEKLIESVNQLKGIVDAVNITDGPMANMRTSAIALSYKIKKETDIDAIFHLTCRDRNVIALQSELLGAGVLGINNLLILTGDEPKRGDHPKATPVFEVDSVGLVGIVNTLNKGYDMAGTSLNEKTNFAVGVAANPTALNLNLEIERLHEKIEKGVDFIQTQPVYNPEDLAIFMDKIKYFKVPVLAGILPLKSYKMTQHVSNNIPGINIPEWTQKRMESGGRAEGVKIAAELVKDLKNISKGIHIMPLGDTNMVIEIIEQSKLK